MGFAKTLGRDYGMPYSESQEAFNLVFYWLIGGLLILFFVSFIISSFIFSIPHTLSFVIPILIYLFGIVFLWFRYLEIENKNKNKKNG